MAANVMPQPANRVLPMPARTTRVGELSPMREGLAALLAHDLKTPLAAISMNLDFVLADLPVESMHSTMRAALDDCRAANVRALRIVSDMADAVRLESGERRAYIGDVDVQRLLTSAARRAAPEAAARGVRLLWSADSQTLRGDEDLLTRAVDRLLERALRHARAAGSIELTQRETTIIIRVRSAMPEENERGGPPESATHGLAMHFAEAAMRAQGGAVWTEEEADGSLLFCVSLPE